MTEPKTRPNNASVKTFVDSIADEQRRQDMRAVMGIMRRVTAKRPKMWGDSLVGYGSYHYEYASGRSGDWPLTGLSPRKQSLSVYIMSGFRRHDALMKKLGKHTTGKSCLYIKKLEDLNLEVLEQLVRASVEHMAKRAS